MRWGTSGPLIEALSGSGEATLLCSVQRLGDVESVAVVWANAAMVTTLADLDSPLDAPAGRRLRSVLPPRGDVDLMEEAAAVLATGTGREGIAQWRGVDGALTRSYGYALTPVHPADGASSVQYLILRLRRVREFMDFVAEGLVPDALTGLPTRAAALNFITELAEGKDARAFGVLFLDLGGMKAVNGALGHAVGDEVLAIVADRIRRALDDQSMVSRISGDEFLIVLPNVGDEAGLSREYARIASALEPPMSVGETQLRLGASTGGVIAPPGEIDANELVAMAGLATYDFKSASGASGLAISPRTSAVDGRSMPISDGYVVPPSAPRITVRDLHEAAGRGQLRMLYQPVYDLIEARPAGAEALLRWQHPVKGLLGPDAFLRVAEATDEIHHLGAWTIHEVIGQVAAWDDLTDLDYYRVGVNISPRQLLDGEVVGTLREALVESGVSGDRLVAEIIESQALDSRATSAEQIRGLIELGLRVAVDDFGSGFANLSYLRDLPVDLIKVDRTLIGLVPTRREEAILRAVVSIASAIGADVVLEGVERPEQLQLAARVGVRFVQGFLVGPPELPGDRVPVPRDPARLQELAWS